MATKKKLLQAAAGQAGGAGLNIEDVFSTYLYTANSSTLVASNGVDLQGEGGLVWIKNRDNVRRHALYDTERGTNKQISSNLTDAERTMSANATITFNSDGFSMPAGDADVNGNTGWGDYASWTFRKAPKFFDVVTYTGDGTTGRQISHDLGHTVGCMIIKKRSASGYWGVYHRSTDSTAPEDYVLLLNSTSAKIDEQFFINDTAPTSTHFTVGAAAASGGDFNTNGATYVAYLFAHNDGDGDFGPTGDQDIIKCGSYTGTGSSGNFIDLGFEPQFMLIKNTSSSSNWIIHDNMRGMIESKGNVLFPNLSAAENTTAFRQARPNATGITFFDGNSETNGSGANYIYIAIRRGPMAVPESATDVFATAFDAGATNPTYVSGFVADMGIQTNTTGYNKRVSSRLTSGSFLEADNTAAESTSGSYTWDFMNGWNNQSINSTWLSWMWKRAPSFCDVVAYKGTGSARTVSHNLGVAPEMMWIKKRSAAFEWIVYSPAGDGYLRLNTNEVYATSNVLWNATSPTATDFTLGGYTHVNNSGEDYIAYLFASLDGVSKVGSYTGNAAHQLIDCGFSTGARFILIRRTDAASDWYLFDSERGITTNPDPYLLINTTAAEATNINNPVQTHASGFYVLGTFSGNTHPLNTTGGSYIFYAIA